MARSGASPGRKLIEFLVIVEIGPTSFGAAADARELTQAAAARLLDVNQPKASALANYRLDGFSVERLMSFLTALGRDVQITIRTKRSARGPGRILIALG